MVFMFDKILDKRIKWLYNTVMKIKLVSDLHLEFSNIDIPNNGCDVLILSGDIMIAEELHDFPYDAPTDPTIIQKSPRYLKSLIYRDFLKRCSDNFSHVVYVAGNHEFYHGKWHASIDYLREECSRYPNIYFLERNIKVIDGLPFLGCTLWTNMHSRNPITMYHLQDHMNDYRVIRNDKNGYARVTPEDAVRRHEDSMYWLRGAVKLYDRCVVVTHMAPTARSIHPRYAHDYHMNGGYHSDLSEFILDHPQIKLWTHGHVHNPLEYMVGETLVACNPRGYEGYEPDTGWNLDYFIDLE